MIGQAKIPQGKPVDGWTREARVEWHLQNWKAWSMSGGLSHLDTPGRSPIIGISHRADFDQLADACDRNAAKMMDAIILDLPPACKAAINHEYLLAVWTYPLDIHRVLVISRTAIQMAMVRKGIL